MTAEMVRLSGFEPSLSSKIVWLIVAAVALLSQSGSGVDVPPDDPLYHGAWEHDDAVGELQGKAVRQLVVEASLNPEKQSAEHGFWEEDLSRRTAARGKPTISSM